MTLTAADGATAELTPPPGAPGVPAMVELFARRRAPRRLGLLLARKGAVAVGIADGAELVVSKVDTHYVQGRTAAGGWSQQRFARRRDNQAKAAAADGAEHRRAHSASGGTHVARAGHRRRPGGGRRDPGGPGLAPVAALRAERFLDVPEPRHAVLVAAIAGARAVSGPGAEPD